MPDSLPALAPGGSSDRHQSEQKGPVRPGRRMLPIVAGLVVLLVVIGIAVGVTLGVRSDSVGPSSGSLANAPPYSIYPAPNATFPSSPLYSMTVSLFAPNGTAFALNQSVFLYYSRKDHRPYQCTPSQQIYSDCGSLFYLGATISWGAFALASNVVAVVTVQSSFVITGCITRPLAYGIACKVLPSGGGYSASFTLTSTMLKISVELFNSSMNNSLTFVGNPLMLFVDPPEDPSTIPANINASSVLYFPPGVHSIAQGQLPIPCGTTHVYLAPGAYVQGGFITQNCNSGVIISGRGVLSGETFPYHSALFSYALLDIDAGSSTTVDGLVLVDSPQFHMASYATNPTVRNVKMMSWPYNSDGFDTGTNGLFEDLFIRANDDSIKIAGNGGSVVRNVIVWQMINGAVVQMGWLSKETQKYIQVVNVTAIHVDYCQRTDAYCSFYDFVILLSPGWLVNSQAFTMQNISISNILIENDAVPVLSMDVGVNSTGYIAGIRIANVSVPVKPTLQPIPQSVIRNNAPSALMSFSDVTLKNISVGSVCWSSAAVGNVIVGTSVSGVNFLCS